MQGAICSGIAELNNNLSQSFSAGLTEDTSVRLYISEKEVQLKIDFIKDLPFHSGDLTGSTLFSKTDNIKLCSAIKFLLFEG